MNFWLQFFLTGLAVAISDVFWTMYMIDVEERNAFKAGIWSASIIAFGGVTVLSYTEDHRMFWAAIIGAFFGTYLTVLRKKR